jgi:hypothetical protein
MSVVGYLALENATTKARYIIRTWQVYDDGYTSGTAAVSGSAAYYDSTQVDALFVPKALGTTKGDILAWEASASPNRLGVGASGTILTARPSAAAGVAWEVAGSSAVASVFARTGAVVATAGDYTAAQVTGAAAATALSSHTGNTANPHSTTAAQAGAPALSALTALGGIFRATAAGVAGQILPMTGLGSLTGAAAPTLTPRGMHSATVTGNITGWTIGGLANGENAGLLLRNPSYSVAVTGLTGWPGYAATSMATIAQNGAILLVQRAGATYYGVA